MSRTVYVNGEYLPEGEARVSIFDRGFLMADGVYEVVSVLDGRLIDFDGHMARLERSLGELDMPAPATPEALLEIHRELVARNGVEEGLVYLQITRGPAERDFVYPEAPQPTLVLFTQSKALIDSPVAQRGIRVISVPDRRWGRRDIKTVQLLYPSMAKMEAKAAGADDAWMVEDGLVTEGTSNNAHIVTPRGGADHPRPVGKHPARDHPRLGADDGARGADPGRGTPLHAGGGQGRGGGVLYLGLGLRVPGGGDRRRARGRRRARPRRAAAARDLHRGEPRPRRLRRAARPPGAALRGRGRDASGGDIWGDWKAGEERAGAPVAARGRYRYVSAVNIHPAPPGGPMRRTLRWTHIAAAVLIGTYLYSPWQANPVLAALVLYLAFPLMALSGLAMWQQPRLRRWLR